MTRPMRVGIYNRWMATMGGGEQHMAAIASTLAAEHDVELVTHDAVDIGLMRDRLAIDLTALPLRIVRRDHGYSSLAAASADYDLFVHCSHLDVFEARARRNAMLVFFPGPLPERPAAPHAARAACVAHVHPEAQGDRFRWTDGRARFVLQRLEPGRPHWLRLVLASRRPPGAAPAVCALHLNGEPLGAPHTLPDEGALEWWEPIPGERVVDQQMILRLESTTFPGSRTKDGALRMLGVAVRAADVWPRSALGWARNRLRRLRVRHLPDHHGQRAITEHEVDSYQLLFANSRYTRSWIHRRWNRPSTVLYPLVPVEGFVPLPKRKQIISVGRFFRGSHNKKHLVMIRAFRELCDRGLRGWSYHLVGGTHPEPDDQAYLREVRAAAAGYPVEVLCDLPFDRLQTLYGESALYWNATGLGEDENLLPDAFEHFGITTVEAMASGCVPVSFARAGQPEIITHGVDGYLWERLEECQARTRELAGDDALRERLGGAARETCRRFDRAAFRTSLLDALNPLLTAGTLRVDGTHMRGVADAR